MHSTENIFTLDRSHPNYVRWQRAIDSASLRGELVANILHHHINIQDKKILDIGCGVGGTSSALKKRGAKVFSVDINPKRLQYVRKLDNNSKAATCDASALPFNADSFDVIILQDVIEHAISHETLLYEIKRVLKSDGLIYLSTPNKYSLINVISDPHWGLPIIALLQRKSVRFVMHRLLHRESNRKDFAQLYSFNSLRSLLGKYGFDLTLNQTFVARQMFDRPNAVVWSNFHLLAIRWMKILKLEKFILKLVNDKIGFFNLFVSPEWYLVCKRDK